MRTQDSGENVWTERDDRASEEKSEANRGWFIMFRGKKSILTASSCKELETAGVEAASSYPEHMAKIINVGGYTKKILNVDGLALYCEKKVPSLLL